MSVAIHAPGLERTQHPGLSRTAIRLSHTDPTDEYVEIVAVFPLMACSAFLAPREARALAADLIARADLIDPPTTPEGA